MAADLRSDADVVAAVLAGDVEAFGTLVDRHQGRVFALAYRMTGSRADAEDIAQEVLCKLYRNLHRYDPAQPLRNWLVRIASNHTLNWLERRRVPTVSLDADAAGRGGLEWLAIDPSPSPADRVERLEEGALVEAALARLPANQRLVFVLKFMEDCTAEEIAEIVGAPRNTVKTWIFRAREALRGELARSFETRSERNRS
jgi:RNA polymerase sigma factor (sigma-70 family)